VRALPLCCPTHLLTRPLTRSVLALLDLTHVADTVVGDELTRGVSVALPAACSHVC
jgi:hypothetical protein